MKKLVFATITFLSISVSGFANVTPVKGNEIRAGIKNNSKAISAEIPDCRHSGGVCTVTFTINGVVRSFKTCCGDIRIVVD